MNSIMIYGAGAMGTVLGAYLSQAGQNVVLVSRNQEHIEALKTKGADIIGKDTFTVPVKACLPNEIEGKYDLILLQTKQRDNACIAEFLKEYLTKDGVICTLQNGLPELSLTSAFPEDKIYGATCVWGATFISPGVVELTSEKRSFSVGGLNSKKEHLIDIKTILSCMGEVKIEENLLGARMSKLCVNAAFSSLSTITGKTFGEIAKNRFLNKIALRIINECFAVAEAAQIKIEPIEGHSAEKLFKAKNPIRELIASICLRIAMKNHYDLTSGMLHDLEKGRKCDIDYINGAIVTLGQKYGVPTPYNEKAVSLVHDIENGFCELCLETAYFFDEI